MSGSRRLWDAVDRIQAHPDEWEKGTQLIKWSGPGRCLIGHVLGDDLHAINDTCYTDYSDLPEARIIMRIIKEQYPERLIGSLLAGGPDSVAFTFNDHRDTRVDDVVKVLEKAAVQIDEVI